MNNIEARVILHFSIMFDVRLDSRLIEGADTEGSGDGGVFGTSAFRKLDLPK